MADAVPEIKVTDSPSGEAETSSAEVEDHEFQDAQGHLDEWDAEDSGSEESKPNGVNGSPVASVDSTASVIRRSKGDPTSTRHPTSSGTEKAHLRQVGTAPDHQEAKNGVQTAIDPLSHHILKRTHTEGIIPQKLRAATPENKAKPRQPSPTEDAQPPKRMSFEPQRTDSASLFKEKKKGVSFLSRFRGNKKKESVVGEDDNESELGDRRLEGLDAHVFSHPIYQGYIPQFPPPPKYIKVRAHNKRQRDFNRVFLAQELNQRPDSKEGSEASHPQAPSSQTGKNRPAGAIWALEFSPDGRFLAAGGQDKTVKIWTVLSSPEERSAHEKEEDALLTDATGQGVRLDAPVFRSKPLREYQGHTADVLDLSWSKNSFLLSSSMDKTVRLWHVSRNECLCCFKHSDFVTSIAFHPRDDRFFLAGSLDSKLRLWSIPDKSVAFWNQLPDLVTAVAFTPDGKTAMAGCLSGLCLFYETEGLKYHTQIHVRSAHGRNAKGSKITGIMTRNFPPDDPNGEVKLLITSNDSRVRLYNFRDKSLEMKFKGNENSCSQIHANFSDDAHYVVCGSEDRKVYIWSTGPAESEKKDKRPLEAFTAHPAIVTAAVLAPTASRQLLGGSGDPLYDMCNPPPVKLVSLAESRTSSNALNGRDQANSDSGTLAEPSPRPVEKPEESPGYLARNTHNDGNIIVTADYLGVIKIFRQDCAFQKRRKESCDTSSNFSRRIGSGMLGRSGSVTTRGSGRMRHETSFGPRSSDRILSWRQTVPSNGSLDRISSRPRSTSPRKSVGGQSGRSGSGRPTPATTPLINNATPSVSTTSPPPSPQRTAARPDRNLGRGGPTTNGKPAAPSAPASSIYPPKETIPTKGGSPQLSKSPLSQKPSQNDPLMIQDSNHSLAFWNMRFWKGTSGKSSGANSRAESSVGDGEEGRRDSTHLNLPLAREGTRVSRLTSEEESAQESSAPVSEDEDALRCGKCGSQHFKAKASRGGGAAKKLVCTSCGTPA